MWGVVGLGPIVAVTDVMQGNFITIDVRRRELRDIGLPVGFVAWGEAQPPEKEASKEHGKDTEFPPEWPNEQKYDHKRDCEQNGHQLVARAERPVEPGGAESPGRGDETDNREQYTADPVAQGLHPRVISSCVTICPKRGKNETKSKRAIYAGVFPEPMAQGLISRGGLTPSPSARWKSESCPRTVDRVP
jgi:hypothetical protein